MKKLVINGREMYEPAEAANKPARKEDKEAKAAKPSNKSRKVENK